MNTREEEEVVRMSAQEQWNERAVDVLAGGVFLFTP
jgi:hypothetical protein